MSMEILSPNSPLSGGRKPALPAVPNCEDESKNREDHRGDEDGDVHSSTAEGRDECRDEQHGTNQLKNRRENRRLPHKSWSWPSA